jgi:acetylornithine/N-succinyldiaminopimelate aminotransferase
LLLNVTAETVVRLLPPLIMQPPEATQLIEALSGLIHDFVTESAVVAG